MKIDLSKTNRNQRKENDTYVVVTYSTKIKINITEEYGQYLDATICDELDEDEDRISIMKAKLSCISEKDIQEYFESSLSDGYYSSTIDYLGATLGNGDGEQITESFDVEIIPKTIPKKQTTKKTKPKASAKK
jgi:hypothetical protein